MNTLLWSAFPDTSTTALQIYLNKQMGAHADSVCASSCSVFHALSSSFTWHELSLQTVELELHEVEFGAVPIFDVRQLNTLRHDAKGARQSNVKKNTPEREEFNKDKTPGEVEFKVMINLIAQSVSIFRKEGS